VSGLPNPNLRRNIFADIHEVATFWPENPPESDGFEPLELNSIVNTQDIKSLKSAGWLNRRVLQFPLSRVLISCLLGDDEAGCRLVLFRICDFRFWLSSCDRACHHMNYILHLWSRSITLYANCRALFTAWDL
jgi:hypothetical protein